MKSELFLSGPLLWTFVWQSTIFVALGLVGSFLLKHRSSRAHQILLLSMIAAVIVPAASLFVKHYELGVLTTEPTIVRLSPDDQVPAGNHETPEIVSAKNIEHDSLTVEKSTTPITVNSHDARFPWRSAVVYAWMAASLILAGRLLAMFLLGVRVLRQAVLLDCEKIEQAMAQAKAKLGIRKDVKVYAGRSVHSPVIWCWGRDPVLLMPSTAGQAHIDWTGIFCHELAHVKRRDYISGLLAELAVCILPWQLFLWLAKARLIDLSEQACDDWVLAAGQSGTDYAGSLLDLTPGGQMAVAPAVVSTKRGLAGRVHRILTDSCGNPHAGAVWALTAGAITICLAVGIAFAQTKPARATGTVKTKLGKSAVIEQPTSPVTMIKGRILDPNNEPAHGALIVALPVTSWGYYIEPWSQNNEGYFELPWSPTWIEQDKPIHLMAIVQDPKSQAALVEIKDPTLPVTVRLEPAFAITGKVVDPAGQEIEQCSATISLFTKFKCQALIYSFRGGKWWERMLSPLPYGAKYKLTISAEGYRTRQIIIDGTDKSKRLIDLGVITLQSHDKTEPGIAELYADPDLEREFHEVYSLDKDEIIKLIKPPFVLGRQEYFQNPTSLCSRVFCSLDSQGAIQAGLLWDGKTLIETPLTGYIYAHRMPRLEDTLLLTLRMPHYDFNLPKELNIEMPCGDWIVRADSPRNEQLRSLEEIIYAETNRAISFEKRTLEGEVIVV
ncbi:MAG: M56 family metallopeptidase, partial [Sedimentisphaerales bacterium]